MADSAEVRDASDLHVMLERVREWVSSAQGQQVLSKAARDSEILTQQLECERRIDPKTLLEPVTL